MALFTTTLEPPGAKNPSTTCSSPPLQPSFTPISPSLTPLYSQGPLSFLFFFFIAPPKSSPKFDPFLGALLSTYPREVNMGITLGSRSSPDTCELHLPTNASCERACSQPLVVGDSSFPAQPAVPIGTIVRCVFLAKLPHAPYHKLATQLAKCMSPFGKVWEIAVHETYRFFDGSGHVVLANTPTNDVPLDSLTYQIAYNDTQKILAKTQTCFGCNKTGHLQVNCPSNTNPSKTSKTSNKRSRHPNCNSKLDRPIIAPKPLIPTGLSLIYGGSEASKHNPRQPALHELSELSPTTTPLTLMTPTETPTWDKEIDDRMITNLLDRDEARALRLQSASRHIHPRFSQPACPTGRNTSLSPPRFTHPQTTKALGAEANINQ
ncbi:CCHC-type zinc finger transcription factor [Phycomyces blakesleeanus NRRL 1555(-)]|uniref:CCHC-type zinc finger transcription factor n=1 Tax=Phycomyces blakesleeanus (strain ATCC 8743b / DSM 1359 / FGSC 10004 / NBRC 33097 / NRRL 1555) TaxID=763407 RepID=A0A162TTV7_PHYB8|nr:CCHC-type zinc finger transcription factor [Phycomyces blakesleeanus NRRL 1555(-)]OAD70952.1 CCHC-type zinc finger transcription factor [Phycomyces blakesleeanus NRRL 1555(-)]|eukprot:XP_018288992.1 CCHC-type zinc finger transcription factor [Phycomyces blakesleeanus NRRL 1555(-)]